MEHTYRFFVGIDGGWNEVHTSLLDSSGRVIARSKFHYSGDDIPRLADWIIETSQAEPSEIAVAIEVTRGPVVETLLDRGLQLYAINPKQLDRFRDRRPRFGESVANVKDVESVVRR